MVGALVDVARRLGAILAGFGAAGLCAAGDGFSTWGEVIPLAILLFASSLGLIWWGYRMESDRGRRAWQTVMLWLGSASLGTVVWVVVALLDR
jgi:hypothetical protein